MNADQSDGMGRDAMQPVRMTWVEVKRTAGVLLFVTGLLLATPTAADAPPPAVGVAAVTLENITPSARYTGRAEAVDRVELRARVQGFLEQRLFEEGREVKAGDLLFVIEKGPYEAILAQREAQVKVAEGDVETAAAQLARGEQLLRGNNIPAAEVDERRARLLVDQAQVLAAQAAVRAAELDLAYTEIRAPIAGRIGRSAFSVGALVGPDSGPLATIVSQDPVFVTFPVSQATLTRMRQEAIAQGAPDEVVVRATLPTGDVYAHPGTVAFAEVEVQPGTDTLSIRANFPNPDRLLTPGQFLGVVVELGEPTPALTIPTAAVLIDQAGPYVLVVGDGDVVEQRRVTFGRGAEDGTRSVIAGGLLEGERVIVEGIQKVRPGQRVTAAPVSRASAS
ncbi:MAG: efflux RND transporter periplasmic adaptor subunit [Geminicoccaceae bacterium]|nr:MAG: efflux RND transporter periplasmic adaptor subunit [Geminicoccaceae bacterium]